MKTRKFLTESTLVQLGSRQGLSSLVQRVLNQSRIDLADLRLHDLDEGERNLKLDAGVPTYVAFFGRDSLVTAWEAALLSSQLSVGALGMLAKTQAKERNEWRDAQPGRMLHEQHTDPDSVLNFSTSGTLLRGSSEQGLKNRGWKDSNDAIVHANGTQVENPLGTCEMQGFAYAAKLRFAEVLWWLERKDEARSLYKESQKFKSRFNERFWMEDESFLAMALDHHDQLVRSIGSDPGRCLFAGIVDVDLG